MVSSFNLLIPSITASVTSCVSFERLFNLSIISIPCPAYTFVSWEIASIALVFVVKMLILSERSAICSRHLSASIACDEVPDSISEMALHISSEEETSSSEVCVTLSDEDCTSELTWSTFSKSTFIFEIILLMLVPRTPNSSFLFIFTVPVKSPPAAFSSTAIDVLIALCILTARKSAIKNAMIIAVIVMAMVMLRIV